MTEHTHPFRALFDRIMKLGAVPSFSSFEERIHPVIVEMPGSIPDLSIARIPHANLIIRRRSKTGLPVVVLSAHLDKINHFGEVEPPRLKVTEREDELEGLLDDAAGLGIAVSVFLEMAEEPIDIVLAFSEMEESFGLKNHPHLLREGGNGLSSGMGARALGEHLLSQDVLPHGFVTIDATPFFKGQPGIALYARHWEKNETTPSSGMIESTDRLVNALIAADPALQLLNNTNDYLEYGRLLTTHNHAVPCIALEPAIFPYHQADERIFKDDLSRIFDLTKVAVRHLTDQG